jgi:hypothetical protein
MLPLLALFLAAEPSTVAAAKPAPPGELAEAVRKELDPTAVVVAEKGEPAATVWFRAEIPAQATAEQVKNGLTVREIPEGTLVGAVKFHRAFTDYRKQDIAAGVYTLRFAVQPDVGDHKGTAPHPEFCLLVPAAKDKSPDAVEVKALLPLSREATGGDHPGVMLLFPDAGKGERPALADRKGGVKLLLVKRPVRAGDTPATLAFGLVVAGASDTR